MVQSIIAPACRSPQAPDTIGGSCPAEFRGLIRLRCYAASARQVLGGRSTVGHGALDAVIGVRIPASQPIFRNIPSSSTAASCGVRFSLLRTCASRTRAHVSSQPPRFQRLGKSQASSNPRQVSRVLKQSASGFGGATGPSTEPTFNRPVFLSYEIIYKGRRSWTSEST